MICLLIRKKNKALKDGLVHYLPPSIKRLLLESSIFDILCNIWFSNRLGKYLHAIFLPFFVSTTREEAHQMFEDINPDIIEPLNTKGLIHLFPETIQNGLLPFDQRPARRIKKVKSKQKLQEVPEIQANLEDNEHFVEVLKFDEETGVLRVTKHKTEIISASSTMIKKEKESTVQILQDKLERFKSQLPTLQPFIGKLLNDKLQQLLGNFSISSLKAASASALAIIVSQLFFSSQARRWAMCGIKISSLMGTLSILFLSVTGMMLKQIQLKSNQESEQKNQGDRVIKHTNSIAKFLDKKLHTNIQSRFDKKEGLTLKFELQFL